MAKVLEKVVCWKCHQPYLIGENTDGCPWCAWPTEFTLNKTK